MLHVTVRILVCQSVTRARVRACASLSVRRTRPRIRMSLPWQEAYVTAPSRVVTANLVARANKFASSKYGITARRFRSHYMPQPEYRNLTGFGIRITACSDACYTIATSVTAEAITLAISDSVASL